MKKLQDELLLNKVGRGLAEAGAMAGTAGLEPAGRGCAWHILTRPL